MERLCFGTFINILAQCKAIRVRKGHLANTVIKTIDPKSKYEPEREENTESADKDNAAFRALNHLYKCTGDFSPQYSSVAELAPKADREKVIQQFRESVIPLIDSDRAVPAILALYDIIRKDPTLKADGGVNVLKFQKCAGDKTIQSFLNDTQYDLAEVLASIFLYTVTAVENTEGKEWLKKITTESRAQKKRYESYFAEYVSNFRSMALDMVANANSQDEQRGLTPAEIAQSADTPPTDFPSNSADANDQVKPTQSLWNPEPEPVRMPDEFYKSYEEYTIADFINLNPMDLIEINYIVAAEKPDGTGLIHKAVNFVKHMRDVLKRPKDSTSNERICKEIDIYIEALGDYVDFLRGNSTDLNIEWIPFVVDPAHVKCCRKCKLRDDCISQCDCEAANEAIAEFEREATEHRTNLQSLYEEIWQCRKREDAGDESSEQRNFWDS